MKILVKMAVLALRTLYFFFKVFLKPRKKITFLSRQSDGLSEDIQCLKEAIGEISPKTQVVTLTKKIPSSLLGKIKYGFHIFEQMYHIATSVVVIVDGYCIPVCVLNHKPEQKFIQLWHALNIIKKFGYQAIDKPFGRSSQVAECMCMHRNYTHIIACSEASGEVLAECFNATMEKIVLLPLPRIDYILKSPENYKEIEKKYPKVFEKPILLYAPTFRSKTKVDLSWIEKTVSFERFNVVVKLHPADKQGVDPCVDSRVIIDEEFSSFEWMKVCDSLITDYSGIGFEAMLRKKKVYYYLYDYEEYREKNGLNLDLFSEAIAPFVTKESQELQDIINKEYDYSLCQMYVDKYLSVGSQDCSKRLAQFVLGLL